jgi:hypothetical protein
MNTKKNLKKAHDRRFHLPKLLALRISQINKRVRNKTKNLMVMKKNTSRIQTKKSKNKTFKIRIQRMSMIRMVNNSKKKEMSNTKTMKWKKILMKTK